MRYLVLGLVVELDGERDQRLGQQRGQRVISPGATDRRRAGAGALWSPGSRLRKVSPSRLAGADRLVTSSSSRSTWPGLR
jgi:hypothetical protein